MVLGSSSRRWRQAKPPSPPPPKPPPDPWLSFEVLFWIAIALIIIFASR
jgi:hypothetical protein